MVPALSTSTHPDAFFSGRFLLEMKVEGVWEGGFGVQQKDTGQMSQTKKCRIHLDLVVDIQTPPDVWYLDPKTYQSNTFPGRIWMSRVSAVTDVFDPFYHWIESTMNKNPHERWEYDML